MIRGIRGAITVDRNEEQLIIQATERLLETLINENSIEPDHVASVFISVTEDIDAAFPAKGLRTFDGWTYVPVMCMREIPVPGALSLCIRIMLHVNTNIEQKNIQHVYLEQAEVLRPDLITKEVSQ
ncbi:chorismate mutase [Peribacillus deserti]|uniref:chorismate mutase n=1 Tax=Peribacillus deserti TaxID=673318 RepID=A0ABS2QHJ3_9BACI|nr:chorismate mutase [Peribacillus deserti]MBM7692641.1 chorismate mutase [Peribacillus deserti]